MKFITVGINSVKLTCRKSYTSLLGRYMIFNLQKYFYVIQLRVSLVEYNNPKVQGQVVGPFSLPAPQRRVVAADIGRVHQ